MTDEVGKEQRGEVDTTYRAVTEGPNRRELQPFPDIFKS
jgi:hypothetical protein